MRKLKLFFDYCVAVGLLNFVATSLVVGIYQLTAFIFYPKVDFWSTHDIIFAFSWGYLFIFIIGIDCGIDRFKGE